MFYLINKHKWVTSFGIIYLFRKKFWIKKVGHTGTLDPLATGLLLLATEKSTKLIKFLDKDRKTYIFSFNIDWISPTWDLEWEIEYLPQEVLDYQKNIINAELIQKILNEKFTWKITQTPPKYSAIKINWKRAYELARNWIEFEMKKREVEIYEGKLLNYNFPEIKLEMTVSAWTYIRTIAEDFGKELWLSWYVTFLHRSKIGNLSEDIAKSIDDIQLEDWIEMNF